MITWSIDIIILVAAVLFLASAIASKISSNFGLPALVVFIALGMLAGSDGLGGIYFDNAHLTRDIGTIALALILFSGGLDTKWKSIKPILWPSVALATLGNIITAVVVAVAAFYLLSLSKLEALLLGAIVSSTDAAAVFGILRSRNLSLRKGISSLLEFESGSNDPMAVFMTVAITGLILSSDYSIVNLILMFIVQVCFGFIVGLAIGYSGVWLINRIRLKEDGLYPAITLGLAFASFGGSQLIGGNGFLSVYLAGLVIGNKNFIHRIGLLQFHDGLAWLMQITMFLLLGLLVFPSQLPSVALSSSVVALALMFIARPLAVFCCLIFGSRFDFRDKLFISWVGLRGAVPIILATIPLTEGVENASTIFNVVFFVVLFSVLLQGTSLLLVGRSLGVATTPKSGFSERKVASHMLELVLPEDSPALGKQLVDLGLPQGALIVLLTRGNSSLIPRGSTVLCPKDTLLIATSSEQKPELERILVGEAI